MKYFNPSYWFKLWVLSAPLFNDKTQGINSKSINNKNIKDWASNNTSLASIENQELTLLNNQTIQLQNDENIQSIKNLETDHFYENFLKTQGWSKDEQIASQQIQEIQEEHHQFLKEQHEKIRNRLKREKKDTTTKIERGTGCNDNYKYSNFDWSASFMPEFWEEICQLKFSSTYQENFINKFNEKMFTGIWKARGLDNEEKMKFLGEKIWDNWNIIDNEWQEPGWYTYKNRRLKINMNYEKSWKGDFFSDVSTCIINDDILFQNKYLDKLREDFPDWKSYKTINLGIISSNKDYEIMHTIKLKYPKLDIVSFEIVDKTDYSQFNPFFSCKIKIIGNKYSNGKSMETFSYVTQTKLNEISNYIANDWKTKQWLEHINDYNKNLPTKIEHLKSYKDSQKWSAKNTEKEIIKGYIRDWSYVHTLIQHELQLDELNKNIQGLKSNFDSIKNQVNELDNKVQNLENVSSWNCANIVAITGGAISAIPVIGTVGGAVATITSGACAIAGVIKFEDRINLN